MPRSLDEIFESDELGLLEVKSKESCVKNDEDRLIESFLEVNSFVERNRHEPSKQGSIAEYALFSRLNSMRCNDQYKELLKPYDRFDLLGEVQLETSQSIEDVLKNDVLGLLENPESDPSLFKIRHVPQEPEKRTPSDFVAMRQPMDPSEFEKYDRLFKQVHRELKEGKRSLLPFRNAEVNLRKGNFYVADGLLCYLERSDAEKMLVEAKSGDRVRLDGRMVTVFENGTYSNMLFRSLGKLLGKTGRIVTESDQGTLPLISNNAGVVHEEDVKNGWIYVLRSKHPQLVEIEDLYKIGFTTQVVADRIKNAAHEATFLYSDVDIVATYACYNINVQHLEGLLHRFFGKVCLNVDVYDDQHRRITPREWFVVPFQIIEKAIDMLIKGSIVDYIYDEKIREIILKPQE